MNWLILLGVLGLGIGITGIILGAVEASKRRANPPTARPQKTEECQCDICADRVIWPPNQNPRNN